MSHKPEVCAIIPARGGSKGVPHKNVRCLAGKPLIAYSIEAAIGCEFVTQVIVSTEDPNIKEISLSFGAEVIDRPANLATDYALSRDVILHALESLRRKSRLPEYFVLLQPTSPLRNASHLQQGLKLLFDSGANSVISVTEAEHHPYKDFTLSCGQLHPLFDKSYLDRPRQTMDVVYRQNGAIYALRTAAFLDEKRFFIEPSVPIIMDRDSSVDIDTELDFLIAETILSKSRQ